ncbi:exodeoxyribonuclease VII small subunit [Parafrankia colletiae]|uniref:Exodeoxyribonuclease 7 small subunit n=1 Tax=Parafrankia colletiae TaxID=573497 RepID=A0A1S1QAD2_9ACTN|nr:exodeoxyribonuclease VII small subunit [Parafrankia colletiae]MCK9901052.1 exodeoxyribonuclease VII small subunit [Frankia sp. Cpl3]OHV30546.1 exodeoxyribonuclease VII small subunit [Parafrankia colletiae]
MTDPDREPAASAGVTYEAARAELEDVVRRLEAGGCALEESLALWERGEELAALCQNLLDGARARLAASPAARAAAVPVPQPGPGGPSGPGGA